MDAAESFAHSVAVTFNTRPRRHGREWRVPCTVHEADGGVHKPSLAVWSRASGYAFKCMTGCSRESVREALRERGVAVARADAMTTQQRLDAKVAQEQRRVQQLTLAKEIIQESHPPMKDGAVWRYLHSRHLYAYDHMECVRAHGHDLVGVIIDLTSIDPGDDSKARAVGVSVLSLNADGTPKTTNGKKFRSIIGTQKAFGVPFGKPGPRMVVAEGIETMIAAMKLLDVGFGVAVLSASNMPGLAVPEWVDEVIIAADNDEAGLNAASGLCAAVGNLVPCRVVTWGEPHSGWDAADDLMKRTRECNSPSTSPSPQSSST